jgi:hypothetical protein
MIRQAKWSGSIAQDLRPHVEEELSRITCMIDDLPLGGRSPIELAERALYHHHLAKGGFGERHERRAEELLDAAIDEFGDADLPIWLHGGILEIAWITETLRGEGANEDVDSLFLNYLEPAEWIAHYDLLSGLTGIGVYGLAALPRPSARRIVEQVVLHLEKKAETKDGLTTWWTPPHLVRRIPLPSRPATGVYDLGVAHGMPAVIGFLGAAIAADCKADTARKLFDGAVRWLFARSRGKAESRFAYETNEPSSEVTPRSAWCYGDPGIAVVVEAAGRAAKDPLARELGIELGLHAAARPPESCHVIDGLFCHGASGLSHIYRRLAAATGQEMFRAAADKWMRILIEMGRSPGGPGGYRSWLPDHVTGQHSWQVQISPINGLVGAGLVMAASLSEVDPDWDRLFMCSL